MNNRPLIFLIIFDSLCWFALGFFVCYSTVSQGGTMTISNDDVVAAWLNDEPAKAGALTTDGTKLFSYRLCIGDTFADDKIALDYTASAGEYHSQTTSQHCGKAKREADQVMHPIAWQEYDALRGF
jgi:hypothetical protein